MSNPTRAKAIVYAVALFAVGGVCGVMVAPRLFPPRAAEQPLKLVRTNEIAQKIEIKLQTKLGLTPDQLARFEPMINMTSQKLEDAHRNCLDQIDLTIRDLHQSLQPFLTEPQISKLKEMEKERADTMARKYNYHPDHPAVTNLTVR